MIEVSHLCKNYGSLRAVDDLSFSVGAGQIVGLLGPNGAGKSTTMNMLTGYLAPSGGTVTIEGHDILDEPLAARRCIGYLPEMPPLYQDMKVREYLAFVAELRGIGKKERPAAVANACRQAGVEEVAGRLIRQLSKGYRQRVGLAAALVGEPPFLILDEPTVGLDPKQVIEMRELIRSLGEKHTVLLSSHILSEVSAVCDHVLILAKGKLAASGSPAELAQKLRGKGSLSITVLGDADRAACVAAAVEGVLSAAAQPGAEPGQAVVSVETPEGADLRAAVSAALGAAGLPVIAMSQASLTLEDIFLQLTGEEESEPAPQEPDEDGWEYEDELPDEAQKAPAPPAEEARGRAPQEESSEEDEQR